MSLIIAALVGAGIAIGITLGVSSGSKSEPANQNLTNQLTVVQTDLRDVKTTVEGTKAQTADTNTRVKDIQQRL
ncbi:MAG TPA: hypothetical protein VFK07_02485, partial [Candidatus Paceibacterota bacterium]|nr:hypothetical protein [Candidatus Paceibacterota bacterium]